MPQVKFRTKSGEVVSFKTRNRRNAPKQSRAEYRHEDVAAVPRGWRVRTVQAGEKHQVRVAFPPGPRRKGSGRLISVLHPRGENPACANPTLFMGLTKGGESGLVIVSAPKGISSADLSSAQEEAFKLGRPGDKFIVDAKGRIVEHIRRSNPVLEALITGAAAGAGAVLASKGIEKIGNRRGNQTDKIFAFPRTEVLGRPGVGGQKVIKHRWGIYEGEKDSPFNKYLGEYEQREQSLVKLGGRGGGRRIIPASSVRFQNPNGNGNEAAAQGFTEFHGRAPKEVLELQEALLKSGDYFALGQMGSLWLAPVKGEPTRWPAPEIEFEPKDNVKLAADPSSTQLYFVGGNQELSHDYLAKRGFDAGKRFVPLGCVYAISYVTEKKFDGYQPTEYAHEFGEETGERPLAVYDQETKRILLVGGAYKIAPPEKGVGMSPGIAN